MWSNHEVQADFALTGTPTIAVKLSLLADAGYPASD